jgi:hypothetical protein
MRTFGIKYLKCTPRRSPVCHFPLNRGSHSQARWPSSHETSSRET